MLEAIGWKCDPDPFGLKLSLGKVLLVTLAIFLFVELLFPKK